MRDKIRVDDNQIEIAQKIIDEIQDIFDKQKISLETTINHDLAIYGDDFDDLVFRFDTVCDINWESFEFDRHMKGECNGPFILFEVILHLIRFIPYIFLKIFNREKAERFWSKTDILPSPNKEYEPLFVADIIVSAIKGEFQYAKYSDLDIEDIRTRLQL